MALIEITVECPIHDSFRVAQVAGMFDVPPAEKGRETFAVEVPGVDEPWSIGVIVGPSGSGKSTIARQAFGERLWAEREWPRDRAVVDGFGEHSIKEITHALTAVGFSSPPSWIKPFHVLSVGERFRCELARALLDGIPSADRPSSIPSAGRPSSRELVVFDEFTSVVDRTVARVGAAAVSKAIRSGRLARRFVAVTCHYDVVEWLEPDWVVDMASATLARGCLRRPELRLRILRCDRQAWRVFGRHHYLSADLAPSAQCYLGCLAFQVPSSRFHVEEPRTPNLEHGTRNLEPAAFLATLPAIGRRGVRRVSRIVVRPDFQGIGVGRAMLDGVAGLLARDGFRVRITTGHPSMIAALRRSTSWRIDAVKRFGSAPHAGRKRTALSSTGRAVVSAEYAGQCSVFRVQCSD